MPNQARREIRNGVSNIIIRRELKGIRMRKDCKNCNKRTKDGMKHNTTMVAAKTKVLKPPFALSRTGNFGKRSISKRERNITDEWVK